jgi:hypothetical protein
LNKLLNAHWNLAPEELLFADCCSGVGIASMIADCFG